MNMQKLMKEAQKAQRKMQEAQEKIAAMTVEGSAGGGMVKVNARGDGEIIGVTLEASVVNPDEVELLEDLIMAAVNDAQQKSKALQEQELGSVMGGLGGMGGLGNLF
ncbi:MAG: YbaB/EbfC family nucleoid-associated protein [Deinococcales bacterium]